MIIVGESRKRSLAKMISWRVIATATTVTLVFLFTGEIAVAAGVGVFDVILKLAFYYGHERAWNTVRWGKD